MFYSVSSPWSPGFGVIEIPKIPVSLYNFNKFDHNVQLCRPSGVQAEWRYCFCLEATADSGID